MRRLRAVARAVALLAIVDTLALGQAIPSGSGGAANPLSVIGPGSPCADNQLPRWDGATNTLQQCSGVTVSDTNLVTAADSIATTSACVVGAAGAANSICLSSGTIRGEGATPDAFNTAIKFGDAPAQRDLWVTAQAATGTVRLATSSSSTNWIDIRGSDLLFGTASGNVFSVRTDGNVGVAAGQQYVFGSAADPTGSGNSGFKRIGDRRVGVTNGSSGNGWLQQMAGRSMLAADYTNATTTFSNTALSISVESGVKYTFQAELFVSESTAADGAKLDFNGGSAAATNFVATCTLSNAVGATLSQTNATTAALATVINIGAFTDTAVHRYSCSGSFEPSGTGTFIVRAAQNAHTSGTLTMKRGSYVWVEDTP